MKPCGCQDTLPCGCCAGTEPVTPEVEFNRPGLPALRYRAGTHSTFLETMEAALSRDRRLDGLTTREASDASIALLDAWATVGDVLTFYQERIANEGYLATATERRSTLELANLVGYRPRPGVSASVFVAYTLDKDAVTTIPAGSLVRSVPAAGEEQQAFETSEPLEAQATWNNLQVRLTRPHTKKSILSERAVYLKGVVSTLHVNDPLLVQFAKGDVALCRIVEITPDPAGVYTKVSLQEWSGSLRFQLDTITEIANELRPYLRLEEFGVALGNTTAKAVLPVLRQTVESLDTATSETYFQIVEDGYDQITALIAAHPPRAAKAKDWLDGMLARFENILDKSGTHTPPTRTVTADWIVAQAGLLAPASLPPASEYHRADSLQVLFNGTPPQRALRSSARVSGPALAALSAFRPGFRVSLAPALANASVTPTPEIKVYSVTRTAPFGHNAGPRATTHQNGTTFTTTWDEWPLLNTTSKVLDLEKEFDNVDSNTLVAVQHPSGGYDVQAVSFASTFSRADYGLAGKVSRLQFESDVITVPANADLSVLRQTKVFLGADLLALAEQPVTDPVCGSDPAIELDGLYDGLTPGRWITLTGERDDTDGTSGIQATELLLLADIQHDVSPDLPGDRIHTFLRPVIPSAYCYKRGTVKIYGNVVKATNGETRKEVLGSGDGSILFQQFALKQPPLTYLTAPTASGSESTLHVFVNDVEWHETDTPVGLAPVDRRFFTKTSDDGVTTVIFGNGVTGSRLPSGNANVRAAYRNGIGKGGNVQPGQLTILGTKPLGVKEVINPLRASGGADKDTRDQIRVNAPLSVTALDRLVSVTDYAYFAQTFAGIGKASSVQLTDGQRQLVHVTIAGIDDIPVDVTSDLYRNLRAALHLYGDSHQPLQVDVRAAKFLVLEAGVHVNPDYPWETVAPKLRAALVDAFRFDRRRLGQNAFLSEVLDVLQRVEGVEYVDANKFGALSEDQLTPSGIGNAIGNLVRAEVVPASLARVVDEGILPAEIAYFTPDVPATIALIQI
jgi:predicted phage baseplate assembly protein